MTVSLIGSPRKTSEEVRLDKNRRIKESIKATKARRKTQTCSTFDLKIVGNKLSRTQREALTRVFLEAKWLWNECVASGDPFSYKPRKNVLGFHEDVFSWLVGERVSAGDAFVP